MTVLSGDKPHAWHLGAASRFNNQVRMCPYPLSSQSRRDWQEGYDYASGMINELAGQFKLKRAKSDVPYYVSDWESK